MQENEGMDEEITETPIRYEDIVTEEGEREVELSEIEASRTLAEAEEGTEHTTDLRTAMKLLLPKFSDKRLDDILQPIMVSRIFPDNLLDLNYLLNMIAFEELEEKGEEIDFVKIITGNQAGTSIGFKGQGRIDILEIAGVAHEEEMEKLAKELGMGG